MKMYFEAWLTGSVGSPNYCRCSGTACHSSLIYSFSESLAQDLQLKLLLLKPQLLPPTKPKCVVTVRVWLHANCGGVLW